MQNGRQKPSILIVDDHDFIRSLLAAYFDKDSLVIEAINGREAVKILDSLKMDLVISDVEMPMMDGVELFREVSKRELNMPMIFITGGCAEEKERYLKSFSNVILDKPFKKADILSAASAKLGGILQ